ncbi:hypothetical protein ACS2G7_27330 [Bacillus cereus group sp. BceL221]|uniref:hypothetical protein n=1 Tax=unclassified Bacillus cereus group TaxID=2750818 RepID=UPI0022E5AAE1|nr:MULTISPECIES: hypothetical protein [unclassified Bacillus cereus group]MDA2196944.1 hypothetical protein [Bacillus cereus group sp. Bc238]MDA2202679.1 hypothetical protein [Bacillus cereus group sp. Bc237]
MASSVLLGDTWTRRGISLLWDSNSLSLITEIKDVLSVREFLRYYQTEWPNELHSANGYGMVVSGLETILDYTESQSLIDWMEKDFYPALLSFQSMYEGQCSLIFWLPDGQKRLEQKTDGLIYWNCTGAYYGEQIPLSQCLWNGAARDAKLIIKNTNVLSMEDKNCLGIYHPRIS